MALRGLEQLQGSLPSSHALSRYRATGIMRGLGLVSCQLPKHMFWRGDVTYVWAGNR